MYYTVSFSFQKEGILGDHKIHVIAHVSILIITWLDDKQLCKVRGEN